MYYPEIEKLFGTPLSEMSKPVLPFIGPTTKKVIVTVVVILAAYGVYELVKNVKGYYDNHGYQRNNYDQ